MKKFEWLDHTADLKFKCYGKNLGELFENCSLALFSAMTDIEKLKGSKSVKFKVRGEDLESLLYEFLEKMIYIRDVEHLFLKKVRIDRIMKNKEYIVEGNVYGDPVEDWPEIRYLDVKSMTYNDLKIEKIRMNGRVQWEATFVLDI